MSQFFAPISTLLRSKPTIYGRCLPRRPQNNRSRQVPNYFCQMEYSLWDRDGQEKNLAKFSDWSFLVMWGFRYRVLARSGIGFRRWTLCIHLSLGLSMTKEILNRHISAFRAKKKGYFTNTMIHTNFSGLVGFVSGRNTLTTWSPNQKIYF
jgi:hypothetical protein